MDIIEFPDDLFGASHQIKHIIFEGGHSHKIDILAATGGSSIDAYLRDILRNYSGTLEINLHVIDPYGIQLKYIPKHWPQEVKYTIQRIEELSSPNVKRQYWVYDYLPCVQAVLIDCNHLFLGFFSWGKSVGMLSDKKDRYTYYRRNEENEKYFVLFSSWFNDAPKEIFSVK